MGTKEITAAGGNTSWLGKKIYYYEQIDSTNTEAKRLAEAGASHGTVVAADMQTAGKGRLGRTWISPKGKGLWFSLILKPDIQPDKASMLTLVAAMAAAGAIFRVTGIQVGIKWPNDLVAENKKVCGILTEMSTGTEGIRHMVIGIGINVHRGSFPGEMKETAISLEEARKQDISKASLLSAVLEEFEVYYETYLQTLNMSLLKGEYNSRLVHQGKTVKVINFRDSFEGKALGINEEGELLVERDGKITAVNSGEVSVRGIYGYV